MKDMTEKHFDKEINSQIPANSGTAPDNDWNAETAQATAPDSIIEVTRVLTKPVSPSPHTATNNGIIQDGDLNIEPIVFSVDSSLKFRQSLEKSGKRYQIQKLLATGGFGRIFLAEDRILGRKAVVKITARGAAGQTGCRGKIHCGGQTQCPVGSSGDRPAVQP